MAIFERYNKTSVTTCAKIVSRAIGMEYSKNCDEGKEQYDDSNVFWARQCNGEYKKCSLNIYPESFANGKFRWLKPWQGLAMPAALFKKDIDFMTQVDEDAKVMAWATKEMFDTEERKLNGKPSRIAKVFYLTNLETKRTWQYNVLTGEHEEV